PESFAAALGSRPKGRILVEASTESEWAARCLEQLGHEVIVADPNYAPMYAQRTRKVKTDRRDARALAEACRLAAYRPAHRTSDAQHHVRAHVAVREILVRRTGDVPGAGGSSGTAGDAPGGDRSPSDHGADSDGSDPAGGPLARTLGLKRPARPQALHHSPRRAPARWHFRGGHRPGRALRRHPPSRSLSGLGSARTELGRTAVPGAHHQGRQRAGPLATGRSRVVHSPVQKARDPDSASLGRAYRYPARQTASGRGPGSPTGRNHVRPHAGRNNLPG